MDLCLYSVLLALLFFLEYEVHLKTSSSNYVIDPTSESPPFLGISSFRKLQDEIRLGARAHTHTGCVAEVVGRDLMVCAVEAERIQEVNPLNPPPTAPL